MSSGYSVAIASPEEIAAIKKRLADSKITVISEAELLQVQDTILGRPPDVVVMHSAFATTSRGATMISRLKGASDSNTAIRVFIEDDDTTPLILSETTLSPEEALLETSRPLDRAGTRQAARYPMNRRLVAVNGDTGQLIDLSVSGAQVVAKVRLRPLKMARIVVPHDEGELKLQGTVAWAIAVPATKGIEYRAGVEFVNADKQAVAEFCAKYGGAPDETLGKKEII